jgi:hypothetical protein
LLYQSLGMAIQVLRSRALDVIMLENPIEKRGLVHKDLQDRALVAKMVTGDDITTTVMRPDSLRKPTYVRFCCLPKRSILRHGKKLQPYNKILLKLWCYPFWHDGTATTCGYQGKILESRCRRSQVWSESGDKVRLLWT